MRAATSRGKRVAEGTRPLLLSFVGLLLLGVPAAHAHPGHAAPPSEEAETEAAQPESTASAAEPEKPERVELNTASAEELCTLPGIGPKKAEAIIAFRTKRPFTRVTQLLRVKGIGVRTLERLRAFIYVGRPPPDRPATPRG